MPGEGVEDGVDVEVGAEGVAEGEGVGGCGYGVQKGGVEDCWVRLSIGWVCGEEVEGRF